MINHPRIKSLRKPDMRSMISAPLEANKGNVYTEGGLSPYSTMKQFHAGSSIETVGLRLEKDHGLQQNPEWYCFRRWSLSFLKVTVSTFGPENFRRN